jgi:hypothetical protein
MYRCVDLVNWTDVSKEPAHAGSSLADFSTLKMEAIRSSETSVQFTKSTRPHISEDGILHSHHRENLKFYIKSLFFRNISHVNEVARFTRNKHENPNIFVRNCRYVVRWIYLVIKVTDRRMGWNDRTKPSVAMNRLCHNSAHREVNVKCSLSPQGLCLWWCMWVARDEIAIHIFRCG